MKSLVHTEELCSRSVPLGHAPGAKSLVCIGLNTQQKLEILMVIQFFFFEGGKVKKKNVYYGLCENSELKGPTDRGIKGGKGHCSFLLQVPCSGRFAC